MYWAEFVLRVPSSRPLIRLSGTQPRIYSAFCSRPKIKQQHVSPSCFSRIARVFIPLLPDMPTTLVLTSAPAVTLQQLQTLLEAQGLSAAEPVAVATGSGSLVAGALSAAAYDTVISVAASQGHHSVALLGQLVVALKPGGRLVVQEVRGGGWYKRGAWCRVPYQVGKACNGQSRDHGQLARF